MVVQMVKYLPCKRPGPECKSPESTWATSWTVCSCNPSSVWWKQVDLGVCWPASLAKLANLCSVKNLVSKTKVEGNWGRFLALASPCTCMCTHTQEHTHRHVHTWKHKTYLSGGDPQIPWSKLGLLVPESWDKSDGLYFFPQTSGLN